MKKLTDFAQTYNLTTGENTERCILIVDKEKKAKKLTGAIDTSTDPQHRHQRALRNSRNPKNVFNAHFCSAQTPKRAQELMEKTRLYRQQKAVNDSPSFRYILFIEAVNWAGVLVVTRLLLLWHSANRATCAFR